MPPPPPRRPLPQTTGAVPRPNAAQARRSSNNNSPRPSWDDSFYSARGPPPKKPLPKPETYKSIHGGSVRSSNYGSHNSSSSRPSSQSSSNGGGSRPGSSSRPGSRGSKEKPPHMPWLTQEAKSSIDNAPPFSHRSSSSGGGGPRGNPRPPPTRPPPRPPPEGPDQSRQYSSAPDLITQNKLVNIQKLAAQHLVRMASKKQLQQPHSSRRPSQPPPARKIPAAAETKEEHKGGGDSNSEGDLEEFDDFKLTAQDDSDDDSDYSFAVEPLALDIGAINDEDEAMRKNEPGDNNASFHLDQSFIRIDGGFEIRNTGLQRTPKVSLGNSSGAGASGGGGGGGRFGSGGVDRGNHAKDSLVALSVLGRGASGVVKKSLHVPTLVLVAQKEIMIFDEDKRHQMVRELKALYNNLVPLTAPTVGEEKSSRGEDAARKSVGPPCPHIVSLYDAFMDKKNQSVNLLLEYMDGGSLQDIVDTGGCDCEPVLANISARVLSGLAFLHKNKQIHRDIKPSNLLINHNGNVKISDLGIVKDLNDENTAAETFTGTFTYMSPERISGGKYSYSSDIWSLGLSVMTVALGRFPFEEAAKGGYWCLLQALKDQDVERVNDLAGEESFSEVFQSFLDLCLKKDPKERPSAEELLRHPFVRDVDLSSGGEGDGEMEGEGSETARNEMEDIVAAVIQFYRKLWVKQSEGDIALTVPNFNKPKLVRLGSQIGLNVHLVQRKMRGLLKVLKGELRGVHSLDSARDRMNGEGSEHQSAYSSRGGGAKAWTDGREGGDSG